MVHRSELLGLLYPPPPWRTDSAAPVEAEFDVGKDMAESKKTVTGVSQCVELACGQIGA